jgi:hypothetical protein
MGEGPSHVVRHDVAGGLDQVESHRC